MVFSKGLAQACKEFRLAIRNRRAAVKAHEEEKFAPEFKGRLWKVKQDGNPKILDDWLEREMWIGKNGTLVYYRVKMERNLMYYNEADVRNSGCRALGVEE